MVSLIHWAVVPIAATKSTVELMLLHAVLPAVNAGNNKMHDKVSNQEKKLL